MTCIYEIISIDIPNGGRRKKKGKIQKNFYYKNYNKYHVERDDYSIC